MNLIELKIPDIGGYHDVNVAEVYVKIGDKINKDDNLIMLETDKATMEIPAEASGVIKEMLVKLGSKVNEGDVIIKLESNELAAESKELSPVVAASLSAEAKPVSSTVGEVRVPDLSGHHNVEIIEVSVKAGDTISLEQSLITLETDKATMEVPSTLDGKITELKVKVGDKVNEGDVILLVATEAKTQEIKALAPKEAVKAAEVPAQTAIPAITPQAQFDEEAFRKAYASPSIRKLARELGVNLGLVKGSAPKGRITEEDVKSFVKGVLNGSIALNSTRGGGIGLDLLAWPQVDFAKFGEIETQDLSRIKKISGANMARNWVMIPHVTVFEDADITELEAFRKELNEEYKKDNLKLTPLAFLIKASVYALKKFPEFNASLDNEKIVYKKYYNIGFAADTPNGLTVPVIKAADKKGIIEIANETASLAKAAREGKLKPTDLQGGTFTVSSLGGLGSSAFTPIINAPEVAILGVSKSSIKPIWNGKEFLPRLILPLSLSFDHRIIDGALGAKFTSYLAKLLSDIRRVCL